METWKSQMSRHESATFSSSTSSSKDSASFQSPPFAMPCAITMRNLFFTMHGMVPGHEGADHPVHGNLGHCLRSLDRNEILSHRFARDATVMQSAGDTSSKLPDLFELDNFSLAMSGTRAELIPTCNSEPTEFCSVPLRSITRRDRK